VDFDITYQLMIRYSALDTGEENGSAMGQCISYL
jgi:hypothetical protein